MCVAAASQIIINNNNNSNNNTNELKIKIERVYCIRRPCFYK